MLCRCFNLSTNVIRVSDLYCSLQRKLPFSGQLNLWCPHQWGLICNRKALYIISATVGDESLWLEEALTPWLCSLVKATFLLDVITGKSCWAMCSKCFLNKWYTMGKMFKLLFFFYINSSYSVIFHTCYLAERHFIFFSYVLGCLLALELSVVGQDRNIQCIQPEGEDLESLKCLCSPVMLTDACFCQLPAHLLSSIFLFPSSLLMCWPLSSPIVSASSLQSQASLVFHPVPWSHKMSVTSLPSIPSPQFFLSFFLSS